MTAPPIQQMDPRQPPAQAQPPAPLPGPPQPPWTPFTRLPTDTEPEIAKARRIRLARLIDSAKFESYPPEWRQVALMEYEAMREIEAAAAQPAPVPGQQPGKPNQQPQPPQGAPQ